MKLIDLLENNGVEHQTLDFNDENDFSSYEEKSLYPKSSEFRGVIIARNKMIESLYGLPQKIDGSLNLTGNKKLTTLKYCPDYIGSLSIEGCSNLNSLKGIGNTVLFLNMNGCTGLTNFNGVQNKNIKKIYCSGCNNITSVKALWECNVKEVECEYPGNLSLAINLLMMHKNTNQKNYLLVMKQAREHDLEEYFR